METSYQAVVELIRATGEKFACLQDTRLVSLWREYSQAMHQSDWMTAGCEELQRFASWFDGQPELGGELLLADSAGSQTPVNVIDASKYTMRFDSAQENSVRRLPIEAQRRRVTVRFSGGKPLFGDQKGS